MFQIDYKSRTPICDQLADQIIRFKILGIFKAGDKLPSVRQTALELGINPNTVQKAYGMLEAKGILYSVAGKGSFLSEETEATEALKEKATLNISKAVSEGKEIGITLEEATLLIQKIYTEVDDND